MRIVIFTVEPFPMPRPQVTKHGVFYPRKAQVLRLALREALRHAWGDGKPLDGPVRMRLLVVVKRPKTVKRPLPSVLPDLDNYERSLTDSAKGVIWGDDGQLVDRWSSKRYADGCPPHWDLTVDTC